MATVTHEIGLATTTAGPQTTAAFTPAAGDLLVVFATASGSVDATPTLTNSLGLTFTKVNSALSRASADTIYCFVANQFAAASSQTVTFDTPNDVNTGCIVYVAAVAGLVRTGLAAIRQSAIQNNDTAGTAPNPAFSIAALTANPCLGGMTNATNPSAMTQPSGWTEGTADLGYASPTTGGEYAFINSGFTGTTVTWGSNSATASGSVIVELDTLPLPMINVLTTSRAYKRNPFKSPVTQLIRVFTPVVAGFSELFTDSAGLVDAVALERSLVFTDSAGLTDTRAFTQSDVITDSAGLTDTALLTRSLVFTDSAGLTDTSTVEAAKLVTQTDSAGLTDAALLDRSLVYTDSAGLTDTPASTQQKILTDSAGLTDTSTVQLAKTVTQTDDTGLTDAGLSLNVEQEFTDSAGLTDAALLTRSLVFTDSAGLTDTSSISAGKLLDLTDSAGLTDTRVFNQSKVHTDSAGLTDTTAFALSKIITDSAGLTDTALAGLQKDIAQTDSVGLTDTRVFARTLGLTDSAGLIDTTAFAVSRVFTDSAGLTDAATVSLVIPLVYGTGVSGHITISQGQVGSGSASIGRAGSTLAGSGMSGRG